MGKDSKIEWTHHTFNPWWGCIKVSPACKFCYAEAWAKRVGIEAWGRDNDRRFFTDAHWKQPIRWNQEAEEAAEHRRVFCASMADVFENRRDLDPWRARLWVIIEQTPWLNWLLLTKRPHYITRLVPWRSGQWPRNVWLGTTAENQHYAEERIPYVLEQQAAVHFASCEPLLGAIDLSRWLGETAAQNTTLNWVIAGGESGAKARPMNPVWAIDLRDQCEDAGAKFHFKQWGHWGPARRRVKERAQTVTFTGRDGRIFELAKLGKHLTGRKLEGQTWDLFPAAAAL